MIEAYGLYTHVRSNRIKTGIVLAFFPFLLPLIVFCVGIAIGSFSHYPTNQIVGASVAYAMMVGFVIVPLMVLWVPVAFLLNQKIIDIATGARCITRQEEQRVWNLLENLCISRCIIMPALHIIEADQLNAYASGVSARSYAVTLTRGLIDYLDDDELECVIAHELTHIRNRDVQLLIVTTIVAGIAPLSCDIILLIWQIFLKIIFAPFRVMQQLPGLALMGLAEPLQHLVARVTAALLRSISGAFSLFLSLFISRRREFMADAGAIELTKNPEAMISALRKVSGNSDVPTTVAAVRQMYFDNPHMFGLGGLFSTHPSIESRINAINRYAQQYGSAAAAVSALPPIAIATPSVPPVPLVPKRRFDVDYEAFLGRQLGKLDQPTKEARFELYKRVAGVLGSQLNKVTPAITEEEWAAEQHEFGEALRNVEKAALNAVRPVLNRVDRSERW
jgi:heat shock protein HtpX